MHLLHDRVAPVRSRHTARFEPAGASGPIIAHQYSDSDGMALHDRGSGSDQQTDTLLIGHRDRHMWFGLAEVEASLGAKVRCIHGSHSTLNDVRKVSTASWRIAFSRPITMAW